MLAILDSRMKIVAHERFQYVLLKKFGESFQRKNNDRSKKLNSEHLNILIFSLSQNSYKGFLFFHMTFPNHIGRGNCCLLNVFVCMEYGSMFRNALKLKLHPSVLLCTHLQSAEMSILIPDILMCRIDTLNFSELLIQDAITHQYICKCLGLKLCASSDDINRRQLCVF